MLYTTDATVMPIHNLRQRLDMVDRSIDDDGAQSTQANECALRESDSERRSRGAQHGTATSTKLAHIARLSRSRTGSLGARWMDNVALAIGLFVRPLGLEVVTDARWNSVVVENGLCRSLRLVAIQNDNPE